MGCCGETETPAESVVWAWQMNHPAHGWLGAEPEIADEWHTDRSIMEGRSSYCSYETRIVSRPAAQVAIKTKDEPCKKRRRSR
jgi:hypothetical protein